jgi:hypothetical protein
MSSRTNVAYKSEAELGNESTAEFRNVSCFAIASLNSLFIALLISYIEGWLIIGASLDDA